MVAPGDPSSARSSRTSEESDHRGANIGIESEHGGEIILHRHGSGASDAVRIPRFRIVVQVLAAMMLYWISLGTNFSSGIVFDRLLLPPCSGQDTPNNITGNILNSISMSTTTTTQSGYASASRGVQDFAVLSFTSTPATQLAVEQDSYISTKNNTNGDCGGFGKGAAETAWVVSLWTASRVLATWIASVFIHAFGVRTTVVVASLVYSAGMVINSFATNLYQLYIPQSLLVGLGGGFMVSAPVHCLSLTLKEKMTIGTGFAYLGTGIGGIVYGYAGKEVIELGDWPWFFRMVAFIALLGIPSAFALHVDIGAPSENLPESSSTVGYVHWCGAALGKLCVGFRALRNSLRKGKVLYRDPNFILALCAYVFFSCGYLIPTVAASHRSRVLGIDTSPSLQVAYIGIGLAIGGCLVGSFGFLCQARGTLLQGITLLLMGGSTLLSVLITSKTPLIIYNIAYSVLQSLAGALCGPAAREFAPGEMTVVAFGHLYLIGTIPVAIGIPLAGWIYDATQSYVMPMVVGGLILVLAGIFLLIADFRIWRQRRQQSKHSLQGQDKSMALVSAQRSRKLLLSSTSSGDGIRSEPLVVYMSSL